MNATHHMCLFLLISSNFHLFINYEMRTLLCNAIFIPRSVFHLFNVFILKDEQAQHSFHHLLIFPLPCTSCSLYTCAKMLPDQNGSVSHCTNIKDCTKCKAVENQNQYVSLILGCSIQNCACYICFQLPLFLCLLGRETKLR